MIVLVLDTALSATSVAIVRDEQVLAARSEPMERGHQERLAGLVRDAMAEACIAFDALDRVGVTVGPGSFTGLRVGLAFAKGLSTALHIPCVGVGTLTALAASIETRGLTAAVLDARRGQVYFQLFENGAARAAPEALSVETAQARLAAAGDKTLSIVGSGGALLALGPHMTIHDRLTPDPVALARLTLRAAAPIERPEPLYLRAPDAKTIIERTTGG